MSTQPEKTNKPLIQAVAVFTVLFAAVLGATLFFDFGGMNLGGLLFLASFLCCVFIAKDTYDNSKATENTAVLEQSVSKDKAFSSEEMYIQLYNNSPVPYILITFDGIIESANIAAVRLFGLTQNHIKGMNVFEKIKTDDQSHLDFLLEKFRSGVAVSDELVSVDRKDKREAWALLSLFSFANAGGKKIGLLTLVDITKQKKAEDAKSEFVSLASHQLRTPIAGMKWSAELLQMDNPDSLTDRQHKYIGRLLESIRRMAVLVDDFLRVSRFELGTFQPEFSEISLPQLCEDVLEEQSVRANQKNIKVETFFDPSILTVKTDPNLMRMIVTNIYTNAVKYTREGGTIHLGVGKKDDALLITIEDNGMGIPIGDQDAIFSKLFRAGNAVRNVPDGTGLGLYIVKEAVYVLRGNISFTSTEDIGTTFEVVLPMDSLAVANSN
jgi:PAS domain S-box-containing protein